MTGSRLSYGFIESSAFGDMACLHLQVGRGMEILLCPGLREEAAGATG
jgi:hypothetical protein